MMVADVSIVGRDEIDPEGFEVGPIHARVDGKWGPAHKHWTKLVDDWLGMWPHVALQVEKKL